MCGKAGTKWFILLCLQYVSISYYIRCAIILEQNLICTLHVMFDSNYSLEQPPIQLQNSFSSKSNNTLVEGFAENRKMPVTQQHLKKACLWQFLRLNICIQLCLTFCQSCKQLPLYCIVCTYFITCMTHNDSH